MNELLLGRRIREMRHDRGLTLEEVGRRADLSKSLLSKIENGNVSPPIATLARIAAAFGVPMGYFFEEEARQQQAIFVRGSERQRMDTAVHGPEYAYEYLAFGNPMPRLMEPFVITIEAGAQKQPTLYDHPGEQFILVLEGEMEYLFGNTSFHACMGDSLYLDARVPHGPKQLHGKKVVYLSIFTNR